MSSSPQRAHLPTIQAVLNGLCKNLFGLTVWSLPPISPRTLRRAFLYASLLILDAGRRAAIGHVTLRMRIGSGTIVKPLLRLSR